MAEWNGMDLAGLFLHSGRLTLRPWQPSDAVAVHRILSSPDMHSYLTLPYPYTESDALRFVTETAPARAADGRGAELAIAENTTGDVVGAIALQIQPSRPHRGDIGYWIDQPQWGNGYATETVNTLTRFAFANDARQLQIRTDPANIASTRVALRCGYRYDHIASVFVRLAARPT